MFWNIHLDVRVVASPIELEDLAERYMDALDDVPGFLGTATSVNVATQILSAAFDVEADSLDEVVATTPRMVGQALRNAGLTTPPDIVHVEVTQEAATDLVESERELAIA